MKRILWVTGDYFIDVDFLIVPYLMSQCPDFTIDWVVICGRDSNIYIDPGLKLQRYRLRYRGLDPRVVADYYRILRSAYQYDLVYSDYVGVPYYFKVLHACAKGKPIIHVAHNVIPYKGWPHKRLTTWYLNRVFTKNNYFHILSKASLDYFKERYTGKHILFCSMPLKGYGEQRTNVYNIDANLTNFLFFGGVQPNKRLDLLIDAIKMLPAQYQQRMHLTVAGRCSEVEFYQRKIGSCQVIDTHFKRIADEEVPELFLKHDYLVLPYENVAQSGPHMVAYYYNLPVIATDIPGFNELVKHGKTGYLFERNNLGELIDVLKTAIDTPDKQYIQMKKSLEAFVTDHFGLEMLAGKYIDFFNSIY